MSPTEEWFYRAAGRNEIVPRSVAEVRSSYSVCVLRKNVTEEILQSDGFVLGKNLFEGDSYNDCARLVKTGAVSLLVDARLFQDKKADAMVHPLMDAVLRLPVGSDQQIHVYLAANLESSPLIVAQLQKALAQLQASGRLEQIQREFELDFIKSAN